MLLEFEGVLWLTDKALFLKIMKTETTAKTATCASCQYWSSDSEARQGECRRHAPQMLVFHVEDDVKFESRFPATLASDWCGDYQAK
jgi:hypothetical protein